MSDDLEQLDSEEIPDDAIVLQCGRVVTPEGTIGRVEASTCSREDL